jgi:hypothetical protein
MKRIFSLIVITLLVFSCQKDEVKPNPITYFELDVDPEYNSTNSEDWVIVHDNNGALLGVKPFESGQTVVFDSTIATPDKIAITFLKFIADSRDNFYFKSYLGIASKEKWTLSSDTPPHVDYGADRGNLTVTINDPNLGSGYNALISDKYVNNHWPQIETNKLSFYPQPLTSNVDDYFVFVTDKSGKPFYKFLENATAGSVEYTLADFNEFDKIVDIAFPPALNYQMYIKAYDDDQKFNSSQGYFLNLYLSSLLVRESARSSMPAAYLNRFSKYYTSFLSGYPDHNLTYQAFGGIPSHAITLLDDDINVSLTNHTITGFALSSTDFVWRNSSWLAQYKSNERDQFIAWTVNSDKSNLKNVTIPDKILRKYPSIQTDVFNHSGTTLYKGTLSYDEFIGQQFKGAELKEYELKGESIF